MHKRIKLFSILFLMSLSLVEFPNAQKMEPKNDVRIVHNEKGEKWSKNLPIKIKLLRTIGDINTLDENLAFNMPSDVVLDDAGNIYILDAGNYRIQKFDPEGKYLDSFGREGQGPGEFNSPSSLDIDSEGSLFIADPRARKI